MPDDLAAHDRELARLAEARRQIRTRIQRKDTPADRAEYAEMTRELDARLDQRNRLAARLAQIRGALTAATMSRQP